MKDEKKKTVLIVDDDADTRTYLATILLRGGYHILTAGDGHEGRQVIKKKRPDLILLDIMMPSLSGLQLLNEIKQDDEIKYTPIIIISGVGQLTGVDWKKYMNERHGCGVSKSEAFMEKPVKPEILLRAVRQAFCRT